MPRRMPLEGICNDGRIVNEPISNNAWSFNDAFSSKSGKDDTIVSHDGRSVSEDGNNNDQSDDDTIFNNECRFEDELNSTTTS